MSNLKDTFRIAEPLSTHWETVPCRIGNCAHFEKGWRTTVTAGSVQDQYIRHGSGRLFDEKALPDGLVEFTFGQGQQCFRTHKGKLEGMDLVLVRKTGEKPPVLVKEFDEFADQQNEAVHTHEQDRKAG